MRGVFSLALLLKIKKGKKITLIFTVHIFTLRRFSWAELVDLVPPPTSTHSINSQIYHDTSECCVRPELSFVKETITEAARIKQ